MNDLDDWQKHVLELQAYVEKQRKEIESLETDLRVSWWTILTLLTWVGVLIWVGK